MAQKYWSNLPEARLIPRLVAEAPERAGRMLANVAPFASEAEPAPAQADRRARAHRVLRPRHARTTRSTNVAAASCGSNATQAVPGRGPVPASLMLVGEQPGDEEDLAGRPFVGPAGRVLRAALVPWASTPRRSTSPMRSSTFNFEPRGKRRIHKTPTQRHVAACLDWLEAEIARVRPLVIVALGATAVAALCGGRISVGEARTRELRHHSGARIVASYHPSAILRAPLDAERERLQRALIEDLERARNASAELDRA